MSGETEQSVSGWTVDTLKAHFDILFAQIDLRYQQRYDAQGKALEAAMLAAEKAVQTALTAAEKAGRKAETAADKRFESVNEFRAQLADQAGTFMPRAEYETSHQALEDKVGALTERVNLAEGRTRGLNAGWAFLVGSAAILGAVIVALVAFKG